MINFVLEQTRIAFYIKNKTDGGIKIDWDSWSMVTPEKDSKRLIHTGVKLSDRNAAQAPTTIPPGAGLQDELIPSDNIHWQSGYYGRYGSSPGGWTEVPIFPALGTGSNIGKEYTLYMPLEIKGQRKEYSFTFRIDKVEKL